MKRLICLLRGHDLIAVTSVGLVARPGGMLPLLDGIVAYKPDPYGDDRACRRCRCVIPSESGTAP